MRIGPIAIYYYNDIDRAIYYGWESAKSSHHTDICIDTCRYFVWLLIWAIKWVDKDILLSPNYSPISNYRTDNIIHPELKRVTDWSYKNIERDKLAIEFGYILDSLQVALWWFYNFNSFEEWMINVVNLWYDSDTNGCIYWFLAGAYYGYDAIPDRRKNNLAKVELIKEITINLSK